MEYKIITLQRQSYFLLLGFSRGFPLYFSTYPKFSTVLHTLFTKMWKTVNKCVEKRNLNEVSFFFIYIKPRSLYHWSGCQIHCLPSFLRSSKASCGPMLAAGYFGSSWCASSHAWRITSISSQERETSSQWEKLVPSPCKTSSKSFSYASGEFPKIAASWR